MLRPRHPPRLPLGVASMKGAGSPPHGHPEHRGVKSPDLTTRYQQRGVGAGLIPSSQVGKPVPETHGLPGALGGQRESRAGPGPCPQSQLPLWPRPGPLQGPPLTRPTSPIMGEGRDGERRGRLKPSQGRRLARGHTACHPPQGQRVPSRPLSWSQSVVWVEEGSMSCGLGVSLEIRQTWVNPGSASCYRQATL